MSHEEISIMFVIEGDLEDISQYRQLLEMDFDRTNGLSKLRGAIDEIVGDVRHYVVRSGYRVQ